MKNYLNKGMLFVGILLLSINCQKEEEFQETTVKTSEISPVQNYGKRIILGKKLKNPYSVENMQKAWDHLKKKGNYTFKQLGIENITTTHLYIKYFPKNTDELKMLEADSTIFVYDYPLDYEILQMGDYYHDPAVPEELPTYQYASIPIGQEFSSSIAYEVLAELYIPDDEDIPDDLTSLLVDESLVLTGNLERLENKDELQSRPSKWTPAGSIRVWDDKIGQTTTKVFSHWEYFDCNTAGGALKKETKQQRIDPIDEQCKRAVYKYSSSVGSYIPVQGVKVRARRWFTTHTGITNAQGYYTCNGNFRRAANYKIKWKRHNFSIWWSWLSAAKYNGPKKKGNWNLNIKDGHQEYYATIFRAAHLYYYGNMFGLTRPKHQTTIGGRLVINAKKINDRSNYSHSRSIFFGADILLKEWGSPTDKIFGVTIHELAHAAHSNLDYSSYNSLVWKGWINPCAPSAESCNYPGPTGANARRLMETWATTVEHYIVKQRYENYYNVQNFEYTDGLNYLQTQRIAQTNFYTSCGIDMLDDYNQRDKIYPYSIYPIDRVKDYTINQLENALKGATTWNAWKHNIKNNNNNSTEHYLDELFANWTN